MKDPNDTKTGELPLHYRRRVPNTKITNGIKGCAADCIQQGDLLSPDKIKVGNLPQDQERLDLSCESVPGITKLHSRYNQWAKAIIMEKVGATANIDLDSLPAVLQEAQFRKVLGVMTEYLMTYRPDLEKGIFGWYQCQKRVGQ